MARFLRVCRGWSFSKAELLAHASWVKDHGMYGERQQELGRPHLLPEAQADGYAYPIGKEDGGWQVGSRIGP